MMIPILFITANAADLVGVVHPLNLVSNLAEKDVKKVFMGTRKTWEGGVPMVVVLRRADTEADQVLFSEFMQMPRRRYDAFWNKKQLSGSGIKPRELDSLADFTSLLQNNPGAFTVVTRLEAQLLPADLVRLIPLGEADATSLERAPPTSPPSEKPREEPDPVTGAADTPSP